MKEYFVTYNLAVKLKDKGYPQNGNHYYNEKGNIDIPAYNLSDEDMSDTIAPQIHEVLKWLREEKNLHIEIWWHTQYTAKNLKGFQFVVTPICENPQCETDLELYCNYETAALNGIEYVIDNLI